MRQQFKINQVYHGQVRTVLRMEDRLANKLAADPENIKV
jgi:hypothetical protein